MVTGVPCRAEAIAQPAHALCPPQVSSATRGQGRLRRMSTTLHVDDPAAKETIQAAMADLSQTAGGRDAVAGLLKKHKTSTTA